MNKCIRIFITIIFLYIIIIAILVVSILQLKQENKDIKNDFYTQKEINENLYEENLKLKSKNLSLIEENISLGKQLGNK